MTPEQTRNRKHHYQRIRIQFHGTNLKDETTGFVVAGRDYAGPVMEAESGNGVTAEQIEQRLRQQPRWLNDGDSLKAVMVKDTI